MASDVISTLKYYCTVHMGNTINAIPAVVIKNNHLSCSNSNNAVSFGSGNKTIFYTTFHAAGKAVIKDASGNVGIGTVHMAST